MDTTRAAIETAIKLTTNGDALVALKAEPLFADRRALFGTVAVRAAELGRELVERHGLTGEAAVEAIRQAVANGALGVVSGEGGPLVVITVPANGSPEQFTSARRWALGVIREARNVRAAA